MVYKTATQKIWVWLFILFFVITIISGPYWKMWSVLPIAFFLIWLAGNSHHIDKCVIDSMFSDPSGKAYKYEPIYDNWREMNAPDY